MRKTTRRKTKQWKIERLQETVTFWKTLAYREKEHAVCLLLLYEGVHYMPSDWPLEGRNSEDNNSMESIKLK